MSSVWGERIPFSPFFITCEPLFSAMCCIFPLWSGSVEFSLRINQFHLLWHCCTHRLLLDWPAKFSMVMSSFRSAGDWVNTRNISGLSPTKEGKTDKRETERRWDEIKTRQIDRKEIWGGMTRIQLRDASNSIQEKRHQAHNNAMLTNRKARRKWNKTNMPWKTGKEDDKAYSFKSLPGLALLQNVFLRRQTQRWNQPDKVKQ